MENELIERRVQLAENLIPLGFYRHYKGYLYEVLSLGLHSDTMKSMVCYRSCSTGYTWFRTALDFSLPGRFTHISVSKESGILLKSKKW